VLSESIVHARKVGVNPCRRITFDEAVRRLRQTIEAIEPGELKAAAREDLAERQVCCVECGGIFPKKETMSVRYGRNPKTVYVCQFCFSMVPEVGVWFDAV
jgi:hypothetical protein